MKKQDMLVEILKEDTGIREEIIGQAMNEAIIHYSRIKLREEIGSPKTVITEEKARTELKEAINNNDEKKIKSLFKQILSSSWCLPYFNEFLNKFKEFGKKGEEYYKIFTFFYHENEPMPITQFSQKILLSRTSIYKFRDESLVFLGYMLISKLSKDLAIVN